MVLAAPVFILSQTAAFRSFYALNREPLLRLGLGTAVAYLSLRLLSKSYETSQLASDLERAARWRAHMEASLLRPDFLARTAASVQGSSGEAALRAALSGALEEASAALALAEQASSRRNAWVVGLQERMPTSGAVERGRQRAQEAAEEARVLASSSSSSNSSSTGQAAAVAAVAAPGGGAAASTAASPPGRRLI